MSDDAMDEVFGHRPLRPNHPDLWRISEILLANDGAVDDAPPEDKDRVWQERLARVGDRDSILYMAAMRAIKVLGPPTTETLALHSKLTALAVDAFITGAMFEQRGGHREPGAQQAATSGPASGQSDQRQSPGRGRLVRMLTVRQARQLLDDPSLDDEVLIVVGDSSGEGQRHISGWHKPDEDAGFSALTLFPGDELDPRDF